MTKHNLETREFAWKSVFKKRLKLSKISPEIVIKKLTGRFRKLAPYVLMSVSFAAVGFAVYFWHEVSDLKENPQKSAQEETKKILSKVSALIILPEGENPIVSTVIDPKKLKDQPFFAKANAGDKVLIYTNAKRAILYNPVLNKIVEVAPVNIGSDQQQQSQIPIE